MIRVELNRLAVNYRKEDEDSVRKLFKHLNPLLEKTSRELESSIDNSAAFDCRVIYKIDKLLEKFDKDKHDLLSSVKALISQEKANFLRRYRKNENVVNFSSLEREDEEGIKSTEFEDPLARVEDEVLFKEKIALLAQDDQRRKTTLLEWSKGANDKSISELLAQLYGGKAESHRKFITRFKTECRDLLAKESQAY